MKKLVLMFVAVAAISFASCGNKAAAPVVEADTLDTVMQDTVPADTLVEGADTVAEVAPVAE